MALSTTLQDDERKDINVERIMKVSEALVEEIEGFVSHDNVTDDLDMLLKTIDALRLSGEVKPSKEDLSDVLEGTSTQAGESISKHAKVTFPSYNELRRSASVTRFVLPSRVIAYCQSNVGR